MRLNTANQIALIAGTFTAGAAAYFLSAATGLFVLAILAGLTTVLCRILLPDLQVRIQAEKHPSAIGASKASLYFQHPFLFCIACTGAFVYSIGQVTNMLLPGLIALHLKMDSFDYSAIETAWSIGALGISVLLTVAKIKAGSSIAFDLLIVAAMCTALAAVPFSTTLSVMIAMHFALGAGFAFVRVRMETKFLQKCPIHLLGRFRANSTALASAVGLIIYFVPLVFHRAGVEILYVSISCAILFSVMVLFTMAISFPTFKTSKKSQIGIR